MSTTTSRAVDLVFQVSQGEYAGEEIRTRVWLASQIARARSLSCTGGITIVDVGYRINRRGDTFLGITDFRSIRDRTVATAVAGLTADGSAITEAPSPHQGLFRLVSDNERDDFLEDGVEYEMDDRLVYLGDELFERLVIGLENPAIPSGTCLSNRHDDSQGDFDTFALDAEDYARDHAWTLACVAGFSEGIELARWEEAHEPRAAKDSRHNDPGSRRVSVYQYTNDIRTYQAAHGGSIRNYRGLAWARWLPIGIPVRADLSGAIQTAQRTAAALASLGVPPEQIAIRNSFNESLTVLIPSGCAAAMPCVGFEAIAGRFAQLITDVACMDRSRLIRPGGEVLYPREWLRHQQLDHGLYKPLAFMPANHSRDAESGLFAVLLSFSQFMQSDCDTLAAAASTPRSIALPAWAATPIDLLADLWDHAVGVERVRSSRIQHHTAGDFWIHADTWDFFHHGGKQDGLEVRVIRAARNLLAFDCPLPLLYALLTPPSLKSGLAREEIERLIEWCVGKHRASHPHADKDEWDDDELEQ